MGRTVVAVSDELDDELRAQSWRTWAAGITEAEIDALDPVLDELLHTHEAPTLRAALLAGYRRGRGEGWADAALLLAGDEHGDGCGRAGCPCSIPQRPCPKFQGFDSARLCPRCGWTRRIHDLYAAGAGQRAHGTAGVSSPELVPGGAG